MKLSIEIILVFIIKISILIKGQTYIRNLFRCPVGVEVTLLANKSCSARNQYYCLLCPTTEKYRCSFDTSTGNYVEGCGGPSIAKKGLKKILTGSFNSEPCNKDRFQPIKFSSNENSGCIFEKSACSEKGQIIYNNGSSEEDRSCSCSYEKGFEFISDPLNGNFCIPSRYEDCSCYANSSENNFSQSEHFMKNRITEISDKETDVISALETVRHGLNQEKDSRMKRKIILTILVCVTLVALKSMWFRILPLNIIEEEKEKSGDENIEIKALPVICIKETRETLTAVVEPGETRVCPVIQAKPNPQEKDEPNNFTENTTEKPVDEVEGIKLTQEDSEGEEDISNIDELLQSYIAIEDTVEEKNLTDEIEQSLLTSEYVSKSEIYYLRIVHLHYRLSSNVVRLQFDKQVPETKLASLKRRKDKDLRKKHHSGEINKCLWKQLNGTEISSKQLNVPLMTLLMEEEQTILAGRETLIKCDRLITQSTNGALEYTDYKEFWDILVPIILRQMKFVVEDLRKKCEENDSESIQFKERIMDLNSRQFRNRKLYRFVKLHNFGTQLLVQIIKDYCQQNTLTVEELIEENQHLLFHRRKKTNRCCICDDNNCEPFYPNIKECEWYSIFEEQGGKCNECRTKEDSKIHCSKNVCLRKDFKLDNFNTAECLVLNITDLLQHMFAKMCGKYTYSQFLENPIVKHKLFHAFASDCCKCFTPHMFRSIFKTQHWEALYEKTLTKCDSGVVVNDKPNCVCQYKSKQNINVTELLEMKILRTVGPITEIRDYNTKMFDCFLKDELDAAITDQTIKQMEEQVKNLLTLVVNKDINAYGENGYEDQDDIAVHKWVSNSLKYGEHGDPDLPIFYDEKEYLQCYLAPKTMKYNIEGGRKLRNITKEEVNFQRIFHLLFKVARPEVRAKFDRMFNPGQLLDNLSLLQEKRYTSLSTRERDRLFRQDKILSSEYIDISLMVYLMNCKKKADCKERNIEMETIENKIDLQTLAEKEEMIMQSSCGLLSDQEFKKYWQTITLKCCNLGGERARRMCDVLEHEDTERIFYAVGQKENT